MAFGSIKYSFVFVIVLVSFFNGILSLLKVVSKAVPTPYIDEIFHIPQAQHYCQSEFTKWDPKITTLPGLYLVSLAVLKPLEKALGLVLCSVYGLRFVNVLGTILNFLTFYAVQQKLTPKDEPKGTYVEVLSSVNLATFPPLFFFTFLYYTDVWSTAFVMLMYLFYLSEFPLLSATAGGASVLMRQTNIIWVGMVITLSAWDTLVGSQPIYSFREVWSRLEKALKRPFIFKVIHSTSPYLIVCIFFGAFLIVNGGVVVGDRSAHVPVLHLMQNLYFLDMAAVFALPYIIFELGGLLAYRHKFPLMCTLWICCALLSEYNHMAHPYLLADNRHLAFYIWKRTFGNLAVRRMLTPTYVFSGFALWRLLRNQNLVLTITMALCMIANLTPQYLFEVRYFIIPFLMLRLHFPQRKPAILLESLFFTAINAAVFYIFLTRHFYWPSEPRAIQRIIW